MTSTAVQTRDLLVVAPWLEGGGAQKSLAGLLRSVPGVDAHVVTLFAGCRNYEEIAQLSGRMTMLDLPRSPAGLARAAARLRPYLGQSDAVYSLMRASHVVLGLLPSSSFEDKAVLASIHQLPSYDGTGPQARVETGLMLRFLRRALSVSTPSVRAAQELEALGVRPDRIRVQDNQIRIDERPAAPARRKELGELRLLFCGRLTDQKGLDRLPELLKGCDRAIQLVIAGDGPDQASLEEQFASLPANVTVSFLGRVQDVVPLIDWSDAALMPSRSELNPVFVWESWSRGRPVIGSDLPVFEDLSAVGPLLTFGRTTTLAATLEAFAVDDAVRRGAESQGPAVVTARLSGTILNDWLDGAR